MSVNSTLALYRDVFAVYGINQRLEGLHNNALITNFNKRSVKVHIVRELQQRAGLKFERCVAFQFYRTHIIYSGREIQCSATAFVCQIGDFLRNKLCIVLRALTLAHAHVYALSKAI